MAWHFRVGVARAAYRLVLVGVADNNASTTTPAHATVPAPGEATAHSTAVPAPL